MDREICLKITLEQLFQLVQVFRNINEKDISFQDIHKTDIDALTKKLCQALLDNTLGSGNKE